MSDKNYALWSGLISNFWSILIFYLDVADYRINIKVKIFFFIENIFTLWRLRAEPCWLAGDGEESGDAQGHPARHVLHVHPEADPGHDDDEDGGDVGLDQVEANTAMQPKLSSQTAVVPWQQQSYLIKIK